MSMSLSNVNNGKITVTSQKNGFAIIKDKNGKKVMVISEETFKKNFSKVCNVNRKNLEISKVENESRIQVNKIINSKKIIEKLQKENGELGSKNSQLSTKNTTLVTENTNLSTENTALSKKNKEAEEKIDSLREQSKKNMKDLKDGFEKKESNIKEKVKKVVKEHLNEQNKITEEKNKEIEKLTKEKQIEQAGAIGAIAGSLGGGAIGGAFSLVVTIVAFASTPITGPVGLAMGAGGTVVTAMFAGGGSLSGWLISKKIKTDSLLGQETKHIKNEQQKTIDEQQKEIKELKTKLQVNKEINKIFNKNSDEIKI